MPLQYKNTFLEFVPAVPELKRSKTSPDLLFTLEIEQKHALDRVDSDAETEYRSSESTEGDSPAPVTSQRKLPSGPLWADMTDEEDDEEAVWAAPAAPAAEEKPAAKPATASWADMSDDDEVETAKAEAPAPVEDDGWTTVVTKKGKKGRR